jgi:UDP-2,3-diacylglucosamine pyrophosphatase LpxH
MDVEQRSANSANSTVAWCVADPHLREDDQVLGLFYRFLEEFSSRGPETLVVLGDLFAAWIALPGALAPYQRALLDKFLELRASGRVLVFIVGNRDYFVESLEPQPFNFVGERWDMKLGNGARLRFEHGDLINASDRNYQRWRLFSRSAAVSHAVAVLPGRLQASLAKRIEKALEPTNRSYKAYSPKPELDRWAQSVQSDGCTAAVVGHFHEERRVMANGLSVHFAPQFRERGPFLVVHSDGSTESQELVRPRQNGGSVSTVR